MALALSSPCPEFTLPGVGGKTWSLADFADAKCLCVVVSCNHCPYAVAYESRLIQLAKEYAPKGVAFVAVNANDVIRYPDDGMEAMTVRAKERSFPFPYLRDDGQAFVRALGARFTPEVFVFERSAARAGGALRYHGRIDDNYSSESAATAHDLRDALDALQKNQAPVVSETSAFGCSVKWK